MTSLNTAVKHGPDVSVIVPTFREAENLPHLVPRVFAALRSVDVAGEIIIVDDNSDDETEAICTKLRTEYEVRLIVRKNERGLATAVVHGLQQARARILIVMDADLSHPPELIPDLYAALQNPNTPFVIGSRYTKGGSTDEAWGLWRLFNSKAATFLARPLIKCSDPMAGFFGIQRDVYDTAGQLNPIGYKIALELMVKSRVSEVHEIPISFSDRKYGTSKLNVREQMNYLRHLFRLYKFRFSDSYRIARPKMAEKINV